MARGWESKSVESQQADRATTSSSAPALSADEIAKRSKRQTLEMSRARALADLQVACRPAHRAMLEAALAELDAQLAKL